MESVRVPLGERSYDILIGSGTLKDIGRHLKGTAFWRDSSARTAIVSNPTVYKLYGDTVYESMAEAGFEPVKVIVPDGEEYKTLLWAEHILGKLLSAKLDRSSFIVALGGGVIGDMAGFAASTYMRGIRFVQAPTTLLAQVDSSVGGKTGVNHPLGKNMIGAFWQPSLVWIDTATLGTLPKKEFIAGMAEVIKYGIIRDSEFFEFIGKNKKDILNLNSKALTRIIKRSCEIKAEVVSKDERESGLRAILNCGHTVGHAIETVTGYTRYLHGEAVAIGMHMEAHFADMPQKEVARIKRLIESYGLSTGLPKDIDEGALMAAMEIDKKALRGELRFVLPETIGSVKVLPVKKDRVLKALKRGG
ncbi:MAG: 3-dehydroquinate synthase [Thermodesulfovibrionales bacterium]|nr:3-dehydroquinate synthase [Thermodesulfovibrionales bacterium]